MSKSNPLNSARKLDTILSKKIENKKIVWFENSNQYVVLEPLVYEIITELTQKKDIETTSQLVAERLTLPKEVAREFVRDVNRKILTPNTMQTVDQTKKKRCKIPEKFLFEKCYQINSKVFHVQFSSEFELSLIHPKFAHLEIPKVTKRDTLFQIVTHLEDTFLIQDSVFIGSWSLENMHYFQGKFSMKIIESMYQKSEKEWMGVFHASAIQRDGKSLFILGDSGNGKSTSLALLQNQGFDCVADDFVPIDVAKKVHVFPAGISIKKNALPILVDRYPILRGSAEYRYTGLSKIVRYLPPENINYQKNYPCKALVFIKYDVSKTCELSKITSLEAFEKLIPDSWISPLAKNVTVFLDWFSTLPCYRLTYSNNKVMYSSIKDIFNGSL